jgi:hypothetical protein
MALCYSAAIAEAPAVFPGSSVVEQPAVNRLVAGSNPARGANSAISRRKLIKERLLMLINGRAGRAGYVAFQNCGFWAQGSF